MTSIIENNDDLNKQPLQQGPEEFTSQGGTSGTEEIAYVGKDKEVLNITEALKQSAAEFNKALEEYLKDAKKEIGFAVKTLEESANQFNEVFKSQLNNFNQNLAELKEENYSLRKLPTKVGDVLNHLVPSIGAQIQKNTLKEFEEGILNMGAKIADYTKETEVLKEKVLSTFKIIEDKENSNVRKGRMVTIVSMVFSICVSSIFTYSLMRYYPTRVSIDSTGGRISIDESKVDVWNMGGGTPKTKNSK